MFGVNEACAAFFLSFFCFLTHSQQSVFISNGAVGVVHRCCLLSCVVFSRFQVVYPLMRKVCLSAYIFSPVFFFFFPCLLALQSQKRLWGKMEQPHIAQLATLMSPLFSESATKHGTRPIRISYDKVRDCVAPASEEAHCALATSAGLLSSLLRYVGERCGVDDARIDVSTFPIEPIDSRNIPDGAMVRLVVCCDTAGSLWELATSREYRCAGCSNHFTAPLSDVQIVQAMTAQESCNKKTEREAENTLRCAACGGRMRWTNSAGAGVVMYRVLSCTSVGGLATSQRVRILIRDLRPLIHSGATLDVLGMWVTSNGQGEAYLLCYDFKCAPSTTSLLAVEQGELIIRSNNDTLLPLLTHSFAAHIVGVEFAKLLLLLAAVEPPFHILVLGDAQSGKSTLLEALTQCTERSCRVSGLSSSGERLAPTSDDCGMALRCAGSVACVDDVDASKPHLAAVREVIGSVEYSAKCSIVASANLSSQLASGNVAFVECFGCTAILQSRLGTDTDRFLGSSVTASSDGSAAFSQGFSQEDGRAPHDTLRAVLGQGVEMVRPLHQEELRSVLAVVSSRPPPAVRLQTLQTMISFAAEIAAWADVHLPCVQTLADHLRSLCCLARGFAKIEGAANVEDTHSAYALELYWWQLQRKAQLLERRGNLVQDGCGEDPCRKRRRVGNKGCAAKACAFNLLEEMRRLQKSANCGFTHEDLLRMYLAQAKDDSKDKALTVIENLKNDGSIIRSEDGWRATAAAA